MAINLTYKIAVHDGMVQRIGTGSKWATGRAKEIDKIWLKMSSFLDENAKMWRKLRKARETNEKMVENWLKKTQKIEKKAKNREKKGKIAQNKE